MTLVNRSVVLLLALLTFLLVACGGPAQSPVVMRMLYGSEKQAWIDESTQAFLATQPLTTAASGQ